MVFICSCVELFIVFVGKFVLSVLFTKLELLALPRITLLLWTLRFEI